MSALLLANRTKAGRLLALKLKAYANRSDVIVLALPRGGVPVAFEIAKALNLPLDICLVRKLGVPEHPELAMGAIAMGGVIVINEDIVQWRKISQQTIVEVIDREKEELDRRDRVYRGNRPLPQVRDRTVILVDDGIATGSTIRAAVTVLKKEQPQKIIIAVPVAPPSTCQQLKAEVDKVICLLKPEHLYSISIWYDNFSQTTDAEVRKLLEMASPKTSVMGK